MMKKAKSDRAKKNGVGVGAPARVPLRNRLGFLTISPVRMALPKTSRSAYPAQIGNESAVHLGKVGQEILQQGELRAMNGMHYEHNYVYNTGSDDYTASFHYELPPTSTILQLSLSSYYEFSDQAHVQLGFTHDEYLDSNGVTRHDDYGSVPEYPTALSINGLTRADWEITVSNCWADWLFNAFFWDSVS